MAQIRYAITNWQDTFEEWWALFSPSAIPVARRDAHPLNWIITPGKNVVAVDLSLRMAACWLRVS